MPTPLHNSNPVTAPDYGRIMELLTDEELETEILEGNGLPEYRAALVQEAERRAQAGAPREENR